MALLGATCRAVHHIGCTSVPGLAVKLAELHAHDRDAYQEAKAPFVEVLLDEAGQGP